MAAFGPSPGLPAAPSKKRRNFAQTAGVHLTIKPQEKTAGSVPHEAVPMKPDDILTPGQLAERLQVKW